MRRSKRLLLPALVLFAAGSAFAQSCASPTPIQITGPVNQLGGPMNGTILLELNYTIPGNPSVVQSRMQVQVAAGTMSVSGAPVCLPANATVVANYSVKNQAPLAGATQFVRYWSLAACLASSCPVATVETATPPNPPIFVLSATPPVAYSAGVIGLSYGAGLTVSGGQLKVSTVIPAPPSSGTYCLISQNGAMSWTNGAPCATIGTLSLLSLTNAQLATLTNAQLASMTN